MNKELFVSSTPHETKVGLVEDDLLAEIYLERENEYTLAGSIYKGRVTRVLPGMQSAFVDIGLERDAFLYVSDFMELEDSDDVEEVPTSRPAPEQRHQPQPRTEAQPAAAEAPAHSSEAESHTEEHAAAQQPSENRESSQPAEQRDGRGGRRGRRGERMPESKFARPAAETPREAQRPERTERAEYGPPPGYQPIILPGESISKYQRLAQAHPASPERRGDPSTPPAESREAPAPPMAETFPEDEPLFAEYHEWGETREQSKHEHGERHTETRPSERVRELQRLEQMNVAAVFGGPAAESEEGTVEAEIQDGPSHDPDHATERAPAAFADAAGTMEEEEIEEEEADLAHYVEELEEDAAFEELEEETHADRKSVV